MKRSILLIISLLCLHANAGAVKRFHIGAEWGANTTLMTFHHFNYMDEAVGFRIDDQGWEAGRVLNAYASLSLGLDFGRKTNLSILGGVCGLPGGRRAVPLSLRASYMPRGTASDGSFFFLEGGGAAVWHPEVSSAAFARTGGGYRLMLDSHASLDVHLCLRNTYDHPRVWDKLEERYIQKRNIRRNNAWYCALEIGVALNF